MSLTFLTRFATVNLLAVLLFVSGVSRGMSQDVKIAERAAQHSIVYIYFDVTDPATGAKTSVVGTGFVIASNGYVLTASHLFIEWKKQLEAEKDKNFIWATLEDKPGSVGSSPLQLQIVHMGDADFDDIALLKLPDRNDGYPAAPICSQKAASVKPGDNFVAFGFPMGGNFQPVPGTFGTQNARGGRWTASSAFTYGMSGGPVYSSDGFVVGLVKGGLPATDAVRWVTPITIANPWLLPPFHEECGSYSGKESEQAPVGASVQVDPCFKVEYRKPNLIPQYLINSMGADNFPYWFELIGKNECNDIRTVDVSLSPMKNVTAIPNRWSVTFNPHETAQTPIAEGAINLTSSEASEITIDWTVFDQHGVRLFENTTPLKIVEPYTIAWDLEKPGEGGKREPVKPEFLLASLAAWTVRPPKEIQDAGSNCRKATGGGAALYGSAALKACYESIFHGTTHAIKVHGDFVKFPDGIRQHVSSCSQTLRNGLGTPLEVALLLVSVFSSGINFEDEPDLTLVIAPRDHAPIDGRKSVYIAWFDEASNVWRAVDMGKAASTSFDDNVSEASVRVTEIMHDNSGIAKGIERSGAAYSNDHSIAVVKFKEAAQLNGIEAFDQP